MDGKHACVDLTEVLPLVGLMAETFTVEQTSLKVASSKVVEHEKSCSDNQHASYSGVVRVLIMRIIIF
jgi:hypothetical protein